MTNKDMLIRYEIKDGRININTAEMPVLMSLNEDITEELAERIIEHRESTPFEQSNHIVKVSGFEAIGIKILNKITTKGHNFRITAMNIMMRGQ